MKRKSAELADATKVRADEVKQQGKKKLDQLKVCDLGLILNPLMLMLFRQKD